LNEGWGGGEEKKGNLATIKEIEGKKTNCRLGTVWQRFSSSRPSVHFEAILQVQNGKYIFNSVPKLMK
jgi:hypothetical protein